MGAVDPRTGTLVVVVPLVEMVEMGRRWGRDEEARSVVVVVRWRPL